MGSVERFEDLIAWQKARALAKAIYQATSAGRLADDYGLARQMQRAAVSILSNIAEGFERSRTGEFHQFLSIAKGSCAELRAQLYLAADIGYLAPEQSAALLAQAEEVARVIVGLRASVARQRANREERR
jgi:four helix bundle protein